MKTSGSSSSRIPSDLRFALNTVFLLLLAHAVVYLIHEYAHSLTAWALGFMGNPLVLDYGTVTPANLVFLSDVADNVQYDPIMAGGHGWAAATIALAGPVLGNALFYVLLCSLVSRLSPERQWSASFVFWLALMCAGNVWSYVPTRAITTHADIAIAARGLHLAPIALFPILLVPALALVVHFFTRFCPAVILAVTGRRPGRVALVVALTGTWFFVFFASVAVGGSYGLVAQAFAVVSQALLFPLVTSWLWHRCSAQA